MQPRRVLIVPAAGLGSRLGAHLPKLLVSVAGVPMIDRILDLYRDHINGAIVVVNPAFTDDVQRHFDARDYGVPVDCVEQRSPTGMLDAIVMAAPHVKSLTPASIWITWCDQVAVHRSTIEKLAGKTAAPVHPAVVMPTIRRAQPYIHFERDPGGRILRVLHRREGDPMPDMGESDIGVFALSPVAYEALLPRYAEDVETGSTTRERNFLPFIPWAAREHDVMTFPCTDAIEAVGVNTPEELKQVEEYFRKERLA